MSDKFENLRAATRGCVEQLGASRNEELFEFRNAATFSIVHELLREYDRLQEEAAAPVTSHDLGTLTAAEAALLESFRRADERSKSFIQTAAESALKIDDERRTRERCEVVSIATLRPPKG